MHGTVATRESTMRDVFILNHFIRFSQRWFMKSPWIFVFQKWALVEKVSEHWLDMVISGIYHCGRDDFFLNRGFRMNRLENRNKSANYLVTLLESHLFWVTVGFYKPTKKQSPAKSTLSQCYRKTNTHYDTEDIVESSLTVCQMSS